MKREDIDKRIDMPDVDAEWARFEREVIAKDAKPGLRHLAAWAGGIGIAAAIALLFVLNTGKEKSIDQPLMAQQTEEQHQLMQPTEKQPLLAQLTEKRPLTSHSGQPALIPQKPVPATPSTEATNVYDCGEISARFPGGDKALKAFIDSLFVCPELAIDYGAKGRIIVTFMVDTLGQTSDFKVARNRFACDSTLLASMSSKAKEQLREQLSEQLSEEATRVLSQMPRWTPAEQFGKIVSQKWTVPVIFNGQEALQRRIAGLTIVPTSADIEPRSVRVAGSGSIRHNDSIIVILNGILQTVSVRSELSANLHVYIHKRGQMIDSVMIYKGDDARKRFESTYGFPPPRLGFWEITTIPDTLSEAYMQQHPEKLPFRRRIEGFVQSEDGKPLADAWISCDTWQMGTATDSTGHFVMWAPRTITQLNVQHVGYVQIRSTQPADTILNFRMKDATKIKNVRVRGKKESHRN